MVYHVQQWYAVQVSDPYASKATGDTMLTIAENIWATAKGILPKINNLNPAYPMERSHTPIL